MGVVQKIKQITGLAEEPNTFRCTDCETTFEGHADPESYWSRCPDCDSSEVELVE